MKRIHGFYVTDEEKACLERYLAVIKERPKTDGAVATVDIYFDIHCRVTTKKQKKEVKHGRKIEHETDNP